MNTVKIFLMAVLLTAFTVTAFGQQRPASIQPGGQYADDMRVENADQPGRGGPMSGKKREAVRKKIEAVRIWRLTETLKLDAGTSARLSALLSAYDLQREDLHHEQMRTMRALQLSVKSPKPDESRIRTDLEKLEKNQHAMQELITSELSGLKSILTIEQQARYFVFQHEFMREMRGMIDGTRACGRGGTGMRSGGGTGTGGGQMRGGPGEPPKN